MAKSSNRDPAIDAVRGVCIVSMVTAHVAVGSVSWRTAHGAVWVDGAMGFVMLSGLVLGLVQAGSSKRLGERAANDKLLRRLGLLYLCYLSVAAVAFLAGAADRRGDFPHVKEEGGLLPALVHTLTLQINPRNAAILSLYVVFIGLMFPVVWCLRRGAVWPVAVGSATLYTVGQLVSSFGVLPRDATASGTLDLLTWQLLFVAAVVVGWYWRSSGVQRAVRDGRLLAACAIGVLALALLGQARVHGRLPDGALAALDWLFGGDVLGIGSAAMTFALAIVLYRLLTSDRLARLREPLARLGSFSLDCYLWLCIFVLLVVRQEPYGSKGIAANGAVVLVLAYMYGWTYFRQAFGGPIEWWRALTERSPGVDSPRA